MLRSCTGIAGWVSITAILIAGLFAGASNPAKAQTGDLTVTVENVDAGSDEYPGSNGRVVLYDSNYDPIDSTETDTRGQATFYDVETGDGYAVEAYHDPDQQPSEYGEEFWGGRTNVSISSGSNSLTLTRNQPYVSSAVVYNEDTGERVAPEEVIEANTPLTIEVTLKNPDEQGSYEKDVRARLLVDQDQSSLYDQNWTTKSRAVSSGGATTYSLSFTPSERGSYYIAPAAETEANGSFTYTDSWSWVSEPRFTVNRLPVAERSSPSPSTIQVSATDSEEFTVEATDLDDNLKSVEWQVEEPGGSWSYTGDSDDLSGGLDRASHTEDFSETGEYRVKAIVYDQKDEIDTAIWSVDVAPQTANLTVQVKNATRNGSVVNTSVPKENGVVKLYTGGTTDQEAEYTKSTAAVGEGEGKGEATFTGLDPSETYLVRAFHEPGSETVFGNREYWGLRQDVGLSSGESKTLTIIRYHPYVEHIDVKRDGESVSGDAVIPGTEHTLEVTLRNAGSVDFEARPRLVLDRSKSSSYDVERLDAFSFKTVPAGGTKTYQATWTPSSTGNFFSTYEAYTKTALGTEVTDGAAWSTDPLLTVESNEKPVVSASDLQGQPSSMYPGRTYTVTATYQDPNGVSNLDHVDLLLDHPQDETIHLRNIVGGGGGVESGQKFLAAFNVKVQEKTDKEVTVEWTYTMKNDQSTDWGAVEDRAQGIVFDAKATDKGGQSDGAKSEVRAAYRNYGTTVLTHGLQFVLGDDPASNKLSRWLRDAACFIRQKAGRGEIMVYDHRDGELKAMGHSDFQSDFYRYFDKKECPEIGNSDNMIPISNSSGKGERIIVFDWTKDSMDFGLGYSEAAANALFALLKKQQKERALEPIHLIGHSRGTAVMSETAERLLASGSSVDQVTYLDPHDWGYDPSNLIDVPDSDLELVLRLLGGRIFHDLDVNSFSVPKPEIPSDIEYAFINDSPNSGVVTWSGTEWSEAYWQSNSDKDVQFQKRARKSSYDQGNCFRYGEDLPIGVLQFLNGRPVSGSYDGGWTNRTETNSEGEECAINHSGIYREYIRTIEDTEAEDSGYKFSRIGGYVAQRSSNQRYNSDFSEEVEFQFKDIGSAIANGNFERGDRGDVLEEVIERSGLTFCTHEAECIPGWNAHGGGGQAKLENGNLTLSDEGTFRTSDRFYVPESATAISFTYKVTDLGSGSDQVRVLLGESDSGESREMTERFSAGVTDNPTARDRFVPASVSLENDELGTVQQVRFQLVGGSSGSGVDATVRIDDVRFQIGENEPPYVASPIDDQERRLENGPFEVDLGSVFKNPEAPDLSIEATSSNPSVVTLEKSNDKLTVRPKSEGGVRITLTATDGGGQSAVESFAVNVVDAPLPSPQITDRKDPPVEVKPGQEFSLLLKVTNDGGIATYGSVSASFPDYDNTSDDGKVKSGSSTSSGDQPGYLERPKGTAIYNSNDEEMTAKYLLTEYADDNWKKGEANALDLRVTAPSQEGTFTIYLRTTLTSGLEDVTKPGKNSDANTATDQQGYRVFEIPVEVTKEAGTPVVENPIADQTLSVNRENEFTKDLGPVFEDPNGNKLSYEVTVSDENSNKEIVSAEVLSGVLAIDPLFAGTATVEAAAKDGTGKSATDAFTVTVQNPEPTLTSISPSEGARGKTVSVTLKGSGFVDEASTVDVSGSGVSVDQKTVNSPSKISATFSIASTASTGDRKVTVSNPSPGGGTTGENTFSVVKSDDRYTAKNGYEYFVTNKQYDSQTEDIPNLIDQEFGVEAALADWKELKNLFADDKPELIAFLDGVGLTERGNDAFVKRDGARFYDDGDRHYFMTRHNGNVPENYLVHDQMHDNAVSLGSWYATKKALVRVPSGNVTVSLEVSSGWNLVSVPVKASDMSCSALFPGANCPAFRYTGNGYAQTSTLQAGEGYWIKTDAAKTHEVTGTLPAPMEEDLASGWNIVGPFDAPVDASSVETDPQGLISTAFYAYDPGTGYAKASTLQPSSGYWVKASGSGTLQLGGATSTTTAAAQSRAAASTKTAGAPSSGVRLRITSSDGQEKSLSLVGSETQLGDKSLLPPAPPSEVFDVRFGTGRTRAHLSTEGATIHLQGASYPVQLTARGLGDRTLRIRDAQTKGSVVNARLRSGEGSVTISQPAEKLVVSAGSSPKEFALQPNYPNPFSERTKIPYTLPEATHVTLEIYDTLGRQVETLVDRRQPAGRHRAALKAAELTSGVYVYRLEAGDFTKVRRMTVVR